MSQSLMGKLAVGGFCSGLLAGGAIVFLLNVLGNGDNLGLPFALMAGGGFGAWTQLRDVWDI